MPHPSAPNAYPSGPNAYPSGPDSVVVTDRPSGSYTVGTPSTVRLGITVVDAGAGTARTGAPAGGANSSVPDTVSGNRTGNTPAIAAQGTFITDASTPGARYGLPAEVVTADVAVVDLVQPTCRTGLPADGGVTVGIDIADGDPPGHRTGAPDASMLLGFAWGDTADAARTGLPSAAPAIDIFAAIDTPDGNSRTGTPFQGPGVTRIWPDRPSGSYTVSQSSIYAVQIVDRSPGATGSYTVLTAGATALVSFPLPDPRTVTILKDDGTPFGSLVPAPIVAPSGKPPRYRLYIYQTVTGRIAYELPFQNVGWGQALNDIGSCSADVMVDEFYDAVSDQDERSPKKLFGQFLMGQYVYSMALTYGNTVVWAGPYSACMIPAEEPTVQIGGSEFASILTKRLLVRSNPPAESSDVTIGPTTKPYLAYSIVNLVTTGYPHTLPWTCSDVPPSVGDVIRNYWGYDLRTAWDALSELATEKEGPDFRFDPVMSQRSDGNYITFDLKIGRPLLANPTTWGWDVPTNAAVGWSVSVANVASQYFVTGAGQDRDRLIAIASSDTLLKNNGPGIELVDDLHSATTIQSNLQKFADADIDLYDHPTATWLIQVQASKDPLLGSYRCGDTVQIRIQDHAVIPDGVYTRRITSLSGGASDYVAIGSSDDYVVQSTTSTGVQIVSGG